MKTTLKFAMAGVVLASGAVQAANINVLPSSSTGSSLVLLLKDNTSAGFYVQELGGTVNEVKSAASRQADPSGKYSLDGDSTYGSLTVPALFNSFNNTQVKSFLDARVGHDITWTVMGAAYTGLTPTGTNAIVATSNTDYLNAYPSGTDGTAAAQGFNLFVTDDLNGTGVTFPGGVSATNGWGDSSTGSFAPGTFIGSQFQNGAAIGTAQSLFVISNSSGGLGSNIYQSLAKLTLNSDGTFSAYSAADLAGGGPPVPLPAAVWLLGSGLAGLVGIGRRRKLAAA